MATRSSSSELPASVRARLEPGAEVLALCRAVRAAGGRLYAVGGFVRDALRDVEPGGVEPGVIERGDVDLEIHGLDEADAERALGRPPRVGASFPVWRVALAPGRVAEVSLGSARVDAQGFVEAAGRRDLRCNAIGFDPLTGELLDPFEGRADLAARRLRATDALRFGEDPLRALRVARLAAQLDAEPDAELASLCARQDLSAVAPERIFGELDRMLSGPDPARALEWLGAVGARQKLAPLEAMVGVEQDPRWHPEGCVWTHTVLVVREAAHLRAGDRERDRALLWGALCHDIGKPATTVRDGDVVRSHGHDALGEPMARDWIEALRGGGELAFQVGALTRHHLAPALLAKQRAGDRAYRKLARSLAASGVDAALLERLARADHFGRTTPDALARRFDAGDAFLARMAALEVERGPRPDAVRGRDVVGRGIAPGPEVGRVLRRCREIQDETGSEDGEQLLARALEELGRARGD